MKVLKRLLSRITLYPTVFLAGFICLLLATIFSELSPFLLQKMIDGPLTALTHGGGQGDLLQMGGFYLLVLSLGQLISYMGNRILLHGSNQVTASLRDQAFQVMQGLPISYFDDKPAGKIATRIVNDTETLRTQFYNSCMILVIYLVRFLFILGILFYLSPMMGLLLCLVFPIFYGIQYLYKVMTDQPMKDFFDARSEVNTQVNELLHGASMIQLYHQEPGVVEEFEATTQKMLGANDRILLADSIASWTLTELLKFLVIAGILTIAGISFLQGNIGVTAGFLFININYVINLFDLMANLSRQFPNIRRSLETGSRVLAFLDQTLEADGVSELKIEKDVQPEQIRIPSMMIQIPVENAVKHALREKEGERNLWVSVCRRGNGICIKITDNGGGYRPDSRNRGTGTGMKVIMQTIRILNNKNKEAIDVLVHNVSLQSGEMGCEVTFWLPDNYDYRI